MQKVRNKILFKLDPTSNMEYLYSDVLSKGGETAESAWNRGYYLSTSIEGAQYNFNAFKKNPLQHIEANSPQANQLGNGSDPTGRPRNINSYVNYELPAQDAKHEDLERDSAWRQSQHLMETKNGKANFGNHGR